MGNFARRIIDVVQNLMLDRLLLRSLPLWPVGSFWDERHAEYGAGIMTSIMFALFGLFGLAWILGAVANRRTRSSDVASRRKRESHSHGFEAWSEEPAGGLRPPAFLRWIVMSLGGRRDRPEWVFLIEFLGFLSAFVLLWALANLSETFWSDLYPALAIAAVRDILWIGATALIVFVVLHQWAGEQRDRLEPRTDLRRLSRSEWLPLFMLSVLAVAMTVMFGFTFQWPSWSVAVPLLPLAVVGVVPGWRRAFIDAMFGKPIEPTAPRPDEPTAH